MAPVSSISTLRTYAHSNTLGNTHPLSSHTRTLEHIPLIHSRTHSPHSLSTSAHYYSTPPPPTPLSLQGAAAAHERSVRAPTGPQRRGSRKR